MHVGSVCSGIGGIDLGLERAGMRVVFQCEKDTYRRAVLARHWPGVLCFEDIREVGRGDSRRPRAGEGSERAGDQRRGGGVHAGRDGSAGGHARPVAGGDGLRDGRRDTASVEGGERPAPAVDLLCGGTPCQDLSVAGRRAGLVEGERSRLFFEFARIADELVRPGGWLLFENVPGLLSSNDGRDFAVVLATLADIGFHDLAYRVLDSRYFGVPQRRRRVFIVGRRAVGRGACEVLLEPEGGGGDFAPSREKGPRVAASLTSGSHGAGVNEPGRRKEDDENIVSSPLAGGSGKRGYRIGAEEAAGQLVAPAIVRRYGKGTDSDATDALIAAPLVSRSSRGKPQTLSPSHNTDGHIVAHTLRSEGFDASEDGTGRGTPIVADTVRSHPRPGSNSDGNLAYALRRDPGGTGQGHTTYVHGAPAHPDGVRATPGLPRSVDGSAEVDPQPDGPRYSACGDAVTVNVAQWIGERILMWESR